MGDMADAQRVVSLSRRRLAARCELVPFECYEPFRAALSPVTFTLNQLSRDECSAQAEECRVRYWTHRPTQREDSFMVPKVDGSMAEAGVRPSLHLRQGPFVVSGQFAEQPHPT
jgi:hypothetical protein